MSGPKGPRFLSSLFRRLLPGRMGAEACEELERQHAGRRDRHGRVLAWLWYAAHLARPDTWKLAAALRRQRPGAVSGAAHPPHPVEPQRATHSRRRGAFISVLDVKLGVRMLFKNPGLTLVSGLAMTVSIAIAVVCFSFFQDFFLRPGLPLPEGERIVSLGLLDRVTLRDERRLLNDVVAWREELESVEDVGAWREVTRNLVEPDGMAEPVRIAEMSAAGFRVAGVPPLLGRPLTDADEVAGAPPVIVIGHDVWQGRFDGDPDVVGRTLQLGRERHTVVGVMPEGFAFPLAHDLWVPLRWNPAEHEPLAGPGHAFAFGRLAPGATRAEASAEMAVLSARRAAELPTTHERLRGLVMAYTDPHTGMEEVGPAHSVLTYAMLALITMILAVPFVNVAILVYARTARRAGEIALRNALGASRSRVVTQLFVEALVLSALAALAGVTLGLYGVERTHRLLAVELMNQGLGGGTPFWAQQGRSAATVAYALGLTLLAAIVAGVVPGIKATGKRVQSNLARLASGNGMRLGGVWTTLIVVQVGTAVALVPSAASLAWSVIGDAVVRPTFETEDLLATAVSLPPGPDGSGFDSAERTRAPLVDLLAWLEEEPSVTGVTYASGLPGHYFEPSTLFEVEGVPAPGGRRGHRASRMDVAPDFFRTLDVPILTGRPFHRGDADGDILPVIVNHTFTRQILGERNAVGRRLRVAGWGEAEPGPWLEIVGVAEDLTETPLDPGGARSRVFRPLPTADALSGATLVLRVPSAPEDLVPRLRRATTAIDPDLRMASVAPLAELRDPFGAAMRLVVTAIGLAISSVLLLAAAGVYALMSFNVTRRRREIAIRSALGADPRRLLLAVFSRSVVQLGAGALVGISGALLLERTVVREMVPGYRAGGGLLLLVAALMVGIGLLSAIGPARRGLAIEPNEALREG